MNEQKILQEHEKKISGFLGVVFENSQGEIAELHAAEPFPSASLIKIPILIYLLRQAAEKRLSLDETVSLRKEDKVGGSGILIEFHESIQLTLLDLAVLMIVLSDNTATNLLIERLGINKIEEYIQAIGLRNTHLVRKLMIAVDERNLNCTTPRDMFLLLKKLYSGELLPPTETQLALDILSRQQYNEKIPLHLPKAVKVMHKTGEISGVRHDCGILEGQDRHGILCLLTKDLSDPMQADRTLAELAFALYQSGMGAA